MIETSVFWNTSFPIANKSSRPLLVSAIDYETFVNDAIYRNAAALCILQIGELVGKLTEEFRTTHAAVPWRKIKAMRNIVAHSYGSIDSEITWEIIQDDIPELKAYCISVIESA